MSKEGTKRALHVLGQVGVGASMTVLFGLAGAAVASAKPVMVDADGVDAKVGAGPAPAQKPSPPPRTQDQKEQDDRETRKFENQAREAEQQNHDQAEKKQQDQKDENDRENRKFDRQEKEAEKENEQKKDDDRETRKFENQAGEEKRKDQREQDDRENRKFERQADEAEQQNRDQAEKKQQDQKDENDRENRKFERQADEAERQNRELAEQRKQQDQKELDDRETRKFERQANEAEQATHAWKLEREAGDARAARPARQPDSLAAARVRTAATVDQKKAEEKDPPGGSNALCFGVHLQGAGAGGGGDSCLVFDGRGVGIANSQHVGPGLGFGGEATFSVKGSTANIDELTGRSIYGTVGVAAGPGVELNGSMTEDGKYLNDSVGVGAGIEASVSGGLEYTDARRLFDWNDVLPQPKVSVMAPGRPPVGPPS